MVEQVHGLIVNQKVITMILGILTILGMLFTTVTIFNGYTFRIDQLESRNTELLSEVARLNIKINELSEKIVDLTIALNRVDDRTREKR